MKILLRITMLVIAVVFVLEVSPAYALLGIRAARTAIAARKAKEMTSSSSSASEEAYAQEKAKFERIDGSGRATESNASGITEK